MVTLENKAEMLAAQLRQRIGVQRWQHPDRRRDRCRWWPYPGSREYSSGSIYQTRSTDNRYHLTGINIGADAFSTSTCSSPAGIAATNLPLIRAKAIVRSSWFGLTNHHFIAASSPL